MGEQEQGGLPVLDRVVKVDELVLRDDQRGNPWFDPAMMAQMYRGARALAASKMVPAHFQGDPDSIFVVMTMAAEQGENPLTMLQNIYLVHGRPGWMTEFLIARARAAGFDLRWRVERLGDDLRAKNQPVPNLEVSCYRKGGDDDEVVKLTTSDAIRAGWASNPKSDQYVHNMERMLRWRTASWWIGLYAPGVKHGLATREDLEADVIDAEHTPVPRLPSFGAVALEAALAPRENEDRISTSPPPPGPNQTIAVRADAAVGTSGGQVVDPTVPAEGDTTRKVPKPNAIAEAEAIHRGIREALENVGQVSFQSAKGHQKLYLHAAKLSDDRFLSAARFGETQGWWRVDEVKGYLVAPDRYVAPRAQPTTPPESDLPPEAGAIPEHPTGNEQLLQAVLDMQLLVEEQEDGPQAVWQACQDAGIPFNEETGPLLDGAPEPRIRKFLELLRERAKV